MALQMPADRGPVSRLRRHHQRGGRYTLPFDLAHRHKRVMILSRFPRTELVRHMYIELVVSLIEANEPVRLGHLIREFCGGIPCGLITAPRRAIRHDEAQHVLQLVALARRPVEPELVPNDSAP